MDSIVASEPIGIVGSGRVASALGRLLRERGEPIVAIAGRVHAKAVQASLYVGGAAQPVACADLPRLASRILIAVPDSEIAGVAETLKAAGMHSGIALHTSGALGPGILAPIRSQGVACGVLHPLQSVATPDQGLQSLIGITFGVGGDAAARTWARLIVRSLDGIALQVEEDKWPFYHAAAALASNGLVALLNGSLALLEKAGLTSEDSLRALEPLVATTLSNVMRLGPRAALTGPIARGDAATVAVHLAASRALSPAAEEFYRSVASEILQLARQAGLPGTQAARVAALLAADGERR